MAASIAPRSRFNESGSSSARTDVRMAPIPQPMSTPTAAGETAPRIATTEPTVAPLPKCTSGMAATWWNTHGNDAVRFS